MTTRVEWLRAHEVQVGFFGPGEDWHGAEDQGPDTHVLTLTVNEVAAIEGSPTALLASRTASAAPSSPHSPPTSTPTPAPPATT